MSMNIRTVAALLVIAVQMKSLSDPATCWLEGKLPKFLSGRMLCQLPGSLPLLKMSALMMRISQVLLRSRSTAPENEHSTAQVNLTVCNYCFYLLLNACFFLGFTVLLYDLYGPTCIFEGNHDDQRCTPEHSRTVCRVLYTHMSSTAFLDHCLKMITKELQITSPWWTLACS